jgi:hypothetical protein
MELSVWRMGEGPELSSALQKMVLVVEESVLWKAQVRAAAVVVEHVCILAF